MLYALKIDHPASPHGREEAAGQGAEITAVVSRFEHPGEHTIREELDVLGKHAEDQAIDEMGHPLWLVTTQPKVVGELREFPSGLCREGLSCRSRTEPLRVRHDPFEKVALAGVAKVLQDQLVDLAGYWSNSCGMTNRSKSQTTRRGGFSSAKAYCWS